MLTSLHGGPPGVQPNDNMGGGGGVYPYDYNIT